MSSNTRDDVLNHWFLLSIVAFILYNIRVAVYNLYFHPLAKYPGPLLARISPWVNFYHATTGKRPFWIWQCHQVYGETFRYHPNGVFINSPTAFRDVFNSKANTRKTQWYHGMALEPKSLNTLCVTDKQAHARKRRILNSAFSDKAIHSAEKYILRHVDRWNELTLEGDGKDWGAPRDFAEWVDSLVLDILGDLAFGRSLETKEPQDNPLKAVPHGISQSLKFINPVLHSPFLGAWLWLHPRGLKYLLDRLRSQASKSYRNFVMESLFRRIKEEEELQALEEENKRKDMIHYLLQAKDPETGVAAYSSSELLSETVLLVVAGSDTTAIILSALFFSLSRSERIYNKLVREIRSTFKFVDEIRSGTTLYACQYLRACVDEAMRFSPTGGSEMPREAGPGGVTVNGEFSPEGTRLSIGIWSLFRNDEVYGDPHVYRPERWIADEKAGVTEDDVARAKSAFFPFSLGSYNCAGKNLAILEILVTVARTLYRMDAQSIARQHSRRVQAGIRLGAKGQEDLRIHGRLSSC
ncbi:benzoate 4-monooxygenase cytochrome P450 [Hyaloscypha variabilis F]|uniref:Benzoate 4-monooxygenase cytochrome P450 n=1 Tax=Hyaloscypha variabilis (strain UAMH 11265 / GT02V1 / F) TaxID=1149755 RepID=A0A2J6RZC6_HYAVF|nr:benzoate 4-monooxygenase cytochrome P450 [Hyaloscypha variabilis F]